MKPEKIILHHSATKDGPTVSWNAIRRYHVVECVWGDIGYHFGIEHVADPGDPAGSFEILIGRVLDAAGAHTRGENQRSIGICFVGNFDQCRPPQGQWQAGLKLVRWLLRSTGLSAADVFGHRDFANKTCPGKLFDVEKFRRDLAG
jgi:hypothetical protein